MLAAMMAAKIQVSLERTLSAIGTRTPIENLKYTGYFKMTPNEYNIAEV